MQLLEWIEYDKVEPFGEWRADFRTAEVVTAIANLSLDNLAVHGAKLKRREYFKTTDFLVKFGERTADDLKPKQTWQDQLAIAKMFVGAHNA